jgi:cob(I)alamin adenosyltransferase
MSIVTKTGDKGMTSLYGGKRVAKDHLRIELCGQVDELSSFLGLAKALSRAKKVKDFIRAIQQDLYLIAAEIATPASKAAILKKRINAGSLEKLDAYIAYQEKKLGFKQRSFVFAGENLVSSVYDICRVLARHLERGVVAAARKKMLKNKNILVYLNRLSDALYLLARSA